MAGITWRLSWARFSPGSRRFSGAALIRVNMNAQQGSGAAEMAAALSGTEAPLSRRPASEGFLDT